ncbi:MAG: S-methyl-5-thioribose-1-phosphate isomerase [Herpetosiphon sp.]
MVDQTRLPHNVETFRCHTVEEVAAAIQAMVVRGAPAIGITAAYGMALAARTAFSDRAALLATLTTAKRTLDSARPTAINLAWATQRIIRCVTADENTNPIQLAATVLVEAKRIHAEDIAMCHAIGDNGATLLADGAQILTHCNAGGLATGGYGTALAPIRTAHRQGKRVHVFVDETRPFLQGARLTAWELQTAGIPQTLITDNMAGYFMGQGKIDCVIVGADRIVANGDVANKIGTYSVAVLARAHQIPFYVAAPSSTIDLSLPNGAAIPIEQRDPNEVSRFVGYPIAPEGVKAAHPAFDVTPHSLVSAYITERGVFTTIQAAMAGAPGEEQDSSSLERQESA